MSPLKPAQTDGARSVVSRYFFGPCNMTCRPVAAGACLGRFFASLALVLFLVITSPQQASAQSASFRSVDTNRDGVLSLDELTAEFGRQGAARLLRRTDRNKDNALTIRELRQQSDDDDDDDDRSTDRTPRDSDDDSDDGGDDGGDGDSDGGDSGDSDGGDDGDD